MHIRRLMAGMTAGVMLLSMGTTVMATDVPGTQTVTVEQQMLANSVKTKTLVKGMSTTYSVKGAIPGKIKVSSSSKGIVGVSCDAKGKITVTAKKTGSTTVKIKDKDGKVLATFKFKVKAKQDNIINAVDEFIKMDSDWTFGIIEVGTHQSGGVGFITYELSYDIREYTDSTVGIDLSLGMMSDFGDQHSELGFADIFSVYITPDGTVYFDVYSTIDSLKMFEETFGSVEGVVDLKSTLDSYIQTFESFGTRYLKISTSDVLDYSADVLSDMKSQGTISDKQVSAYIDLISAVKSGDKAKLVDFVKSIDGVPASFNLDSKTLESVYNVLRDSFSARLQLSGSKIMVNRENYKSISVSSSEMSALAKVWNTWISSDAAPAIKKIKSILKKSGVDTSFLSNIKLSDYKIPSDIIEGIMNSPSDLDVQLSVSGNNGDAKTLSGSINTYDSTDDSGASVNVSITRGNLGLDCNEYFADSYDLLQLDAVKDFIKSAVESAVSDSVAMYDTGAAISWD